jgi:TonB family protein
MNRRKLLSLFLSILIHLTVILFFLWLTHKSEKMLTSTGAKRVELSLKDFVTPPPARPAHKPTPPSPPAPKPAPKPTPKPAPKPAPRPVEKPVEKPAPKPVEKKAEKVETPQPEKVEKKTVERPVKPRPVAKKAHKPATVKKPVHKPKPKPIPKPKPKPRPKTPESALAGALGAPAVPSAPARPSRPTPPSIDQINNAMGEREFRALYKDEFDHFTPDQKKFIRNNLNRIQAITQHYLTMRGYPPFAVEQHMQGINVVEFYLHPNGDITDLKVISSSGYHVLDDNSLDTIRTAYKDYPRPKETTKIRFYIHYQLY